MKSRLVEISVFFVFVFTCVCDAQVEVKDIAAANFNKAEAKLKVCYEKVLEGTRNKVTKKSLIASQEMWLKYRDHEASFRAGLSSGGGSAYTMDFLGYLTDLTNQRLEDLTKILKML